MLQALQKNDINNKEIEKKYTFNSLLKIISNVCVYYDLPRGIVQATL